MENFKSKLTKHKFIRLTSKGANSFSDQNGYVGNVHDNHFEFNLVINAYEHFSNISAPPEFETHLVQFSDIIEIKNG
jgi:hypothetical protein